MECPVCGSELERTTYESLGVMRCGNCHGYLIDRNRATGVRNRREKTVQELMVEAKLEMQPDSEEALRCPRCRRKMKKIKTRWTSGFVLDDCDACSLLWFDGGELALMQLQYEGSDAGQDRANRQQRLKNLSPEEKAELQRRIDDLPPPENVVNWLFELEESRRHHWR